MLEEFNKMNAKPELKVALSIISLIKQSANLF